MATVVFNKCDCCCPLPEGQCCLLDFFTQAVMTIEGIQQNPLLPPAPFCECLNTTYVIDLTNDVNPATEQFGIDCDGLVPGHRIYGLASPPVRCEEVSSTPGVYTIRSVNPANALSVKIERPDDFNPSIWRQFESSVLIDLIPVGSVRQLCFHRSRPLKTCAEYLPEALPQPALGGVVYLLGVSSCIATNARGSVVLQ